jgi:hypothetical protein
MRPGTLTESDKADLGMIGSNKGMDVISFDQAREVARRKAMKSVGLSEASREMGGREVAGLQVQERAVAAPLGSGRSEVVGSKPTPRAQAAQGQIDQAVRAAIAELGPEGAYQELRNSGRFSDDELRAMFARLMGQ